MPPRSRARGTKAEPCARGEAVGRATNRSRRRCRTPAMAQAHHSPAYARALTLVSNTEAVCLSVQRMAAARVTVARAPRDWSSSAARTIPVTVDRRLTPSPLRLWANSATPCARTGNPLDTHFEPLELREDCTSTTPSLALRPDSIRIPMKYRPNCDAQWRDACTVRPSRSSAVADGSRRRR